MKKARLASGLAHELLGEGHVMAAQVKSNSASGLDGGLAIAEKCQARSMGDITQFAECLVSSYQGCGYALSFGGACLCRHPLHEEIVRRTLRRQLTPPPPCTPCPSRVER